MEDFSEFPLYINCEEIKKKITTSINRDERLYQLRNQITNSIMSAMKQNIYNPHNGAYSFPIRIDLSRQRLNYKQITQLYNELTERGFSIRYEMIHTIMNSTTTKEIEYRDIDPYGDMPISIKINCL